jgi:hypothetical protein
MATPCRPTPRRALFIIVNRGRRHRGRERDHRASRRAADAAHHEGADRRLPRDGEQHPLHVGMLDDRARALGGGGRAALAAVAGVGYARDRRQGRAAAATEGASAIIEHPDVQRMLLTMCRPTPRRALFIIVNMQASPRLASPTSQPVAPSYTRLHVHDDEQRPPRRRPAGRGHRRARLPAGPVLRPVAPSYTMVQVGEP